MNSDRSFSMISGWLKFDTRSMTPLFQVQPKGCPSIAQMKMGFCCSAAICCAFNKLVSHGIVFQASCSEFSESCSRWNVSSFSPCARTVNGTRANVATANNVREMEELVIDELQKKIDMTECTLSALTIKTDGEPCERFERTP